MISPQTEPPQRPNYKLSLLPVHAFEMASRLEVLLESMMHTVTVAQRVSSRLGVATPFQDPPPKSPTAAKSPDGTVAGDTYHGLEMIDTLTHGIEAAHSAVRDILGTLLDSVEGDAIGTAIDDAAGPLRPMSVGALRNVAPRR